MLHWARVIEWEFRCFEEGEGNGGSQQDMDHGTVESDHGLLGHHWSHVSHNADRHEVQVTTYSCIEELLRDNSRFDWAYA